MPSFYQKVYKVLKKVPPGKVTTYKKIAQKLNIKAYQAVGQALKKNPDAPIIPCHRVVKSDGAIGGFMGKTSGKAIQKKIKMLKKEGISFSDKKIKNFKKVLAKL
jgi:methylated-DNA-[protein]-cysteine S-methyltransferase